MLRRAAAVSLQEYWRSAFLAYAAINFEINLCGGSREQSELLSAPQNKIKSPTAISTFPLEKWNPNISPRCFIDLPRCRRNSPSSFSLPSCREREREKEERIVAMTFQSSLARLVSFDPCGQI